ncbi:MAG: lysophospholipid acyltransferase family protein [Verrucomicrobiota bacterium]|nr:lysophospholipid acyltransferase family protein [Verrucomicrobiota bacterium]
MKDYLDTLLYMLGRCVVFLIQLFPLGWVAALGRLAGFLAFYLDRRHRRVAIGQLRWFLGKTARKGDPVSMARTHYRHLGENYLCAIKTAGMSDKDLERSTEFTGMNLFSKAPTRDTPPGWKNGWIIAIGHFGNFELYARSLGGLNGRVGAATYRGLNQPGLDRLLQELRARSGVQFFDRRKHVAALRRLMGKGSVVLGLLADQATGSGIAIDFLGERCTCSTAPAVLSHRYQCRVATAICHRTGPASWRVEFGSEIPTMFRGQRRSVEDLTRDINHVFEKAVLAEPLNWFWVHDRWKRYRKKRKASPSRP